MSLAEQSQQWFPTSVQVTVHQARNLRVKGKNGTNDAYAIIQVAKDKFSTSVAEKSVAPLWKEEAAFDLPLFHPGNAERCTLFVIVMHRAHAGLDKFLGQAVVNLLDLHDNKSRKKSDWFKLVDKSGKEDKARGEVLLDIHFMRNNLSASMVDLSMQDKPRSRISKLKDKVRGKKKDGFSDSASAIVPPVSQVLTDSEGEADSVSLNQTPGDKKKSKFKKLFAPKSNLQRNTSQSMSTLGTLPEKNSSLSGSRSSGLNVDSPEVRKKFKFLGHKRTGSSDSRVSQGPFSLLGRSKHSASDLNNLCINGSHVYAEEGEPKSGSTPSLNSSGLGSVEDVQKHTSDFSEECVRSTPAPASRHESQAVSEQQRHQEDEERKQADARRSAEAKKLEEEEKYRAEAKRLQEEEQERKRLSSEEEARKRKQREEEEERRKKEEERRHWEAAENEKLEEERRRLEQQRQEEQAQKGQEEASMSERLSSLFGMIRKKEEKKEESQQHSEEDGPSQEPPADTGDPHQSVPHRSTNPFIDVPLTSDTPASSAGGPEDTSNLSPPVSSAMVFLNRAAKVSKVKPRLAHSVTSDQTDPPTPSQQCPSPAASESTLSSVPSESPETFSSLHSSLAPPHLSPSLTVSSAEDLCVESSAVMYDSRRKALPPLYETQNGEDHHAPARENRNSGHVEAGGPQQGKKGSLPLPDYDTLFPQRRHGVQGQTRWDHIIAEVNQRNRDAPPVLLGPEMSVDGPGEQDPKRQSSLSQESPSVGRYKSHSQEAKPISSKKAAAPAPPKSGLSPNPTTVGHSSPGQTSQSVKGPNPTTAPRLMNPGASNGLSGMSREETNKVLDSHVHRPSSQMDSAPPVEQRRSSADKAPTAKPRQRVSVRESAQEQSVYDGNTTGTTQTSSTAGVSDMDSEGRRGKENILLFDPFPSTELLSKDPWAQLNQSREMDSVSVFTSSVHKEKKPEDRGMTPNDLDTIFSQDIASDPFAGFNDHKNGEEISQRSVVDDPEQMSPAFQRQNSQRWKRHSRDVTNEFMTPTKAADTKEQTHVSGEESSFSSEYFTAPSTFDSSDSLQVIMEEPASQAGVLSGGKPPLRAWVSPSEVQPVSAQNSNGGGLAVTSRRPHPVKPMNSLETQHFISTPAVKDVKVHSSTPAKTLLSDSVGSGPYTQLTQEELITLVVKQQADLSRKETKIVELEEYIDKLLVRVIEEKPAILQALNSAKPV